MGSWMDSIARWFPPKGAGGSSAPPAMWEICPIAHRLLRGVFTGWDEGWGGHGWPITGGEAPNATHQEGRMAAAS
jgi:hypothetical protein